MAGQAAEPGTEPALAEAGQRLDEDRPYEALSAALRAEGAISIDDCDNVNTSFPGFAELAEQAGLMIRAVRE